MSTFDVRKIRELLSSDTESVHEAFELWLTFCTDGESFVKNLLKVLHLLPSTFHASTEKVNLIQDATSHFAEREIILRRIWKHLEEFGVEWAINRERRYVIQIGDWQWSSESFSSYIEKIDKTAYNYWKSKSSKEIISYCNDVTSQDYLTTPLQSMEDFKKFKPNVPSDAHMIFGNWSGFAWTPFAFSSVGCGWCVSSSWTNVFIYEELWGSGWPQDNPGAILMWKGDRDALTRHKELSFVPAKVKREIIREDEYFLELIQQEGVAEVFSLNIHNPIDFTKLTFKETVNKLAGVCFDTVVYDGSELKGSMDYGDSTYGITSVNLYKGLPQYSIE